MAITFRAADLDSATDYQHSSLGLPAAQPLSGDIDNADHLVFTSPDGKTNSGSWECEPSESRWEFNTRGEFIHVIAGAMTVQEDGGEPQILTVGDSAVFPVGWKGTWTITEHLRKVYVVFRP